MDNMYQNNVPVKKKRWPVIAAIIAIVMVVAAAGIYFAYPAIKRKTATAAGAADILKAETDRIREDFQTQLSGIESGESLGIINCSGTVTLDNFSQGVTDYKSYLKADELKYDIHTDMSSGIASGTLSIGERAKDSEVKINFYKDTEYIYLSIPELTSQTFKVSINELIRRVISQENDSFSISDKYSDILNSADTYTYLIKMLTGKINNNSIKDYAKAAREISPYIFNAINTMWENAGYEKGEDVTVASKRGTEKQDARTYTVTISNDAVNKMVENAINSIYADSKLTSYTSLITSVTKISKDTLILGIEKALKDVDNVKFNITVNDDDRVVGVRFDLSAITGNSTDVINLTMTGNNNPSDYTTCSVSLADGSDLSLGVSISYDNETKGQAENIKLSDFSNPVDVFNMSSVQLVQVSRDIMLHADILKNIFTDKAISEFMY